MKTLAILGSTGSIGRSALSVVARYPDRFRVRGLTAGSNVDLLAQQVVAFRPRMVAVAAEESARRLKELLTGHAPLPEILSGVEGISAVAGMEEAEMVLAAIVGSAGLLPTLTAVRAGKTIALANKETLVAAGELVKAEAARSGARIFPVDSEHSALFQCMNGSPRTTVKRLLLTASGGPFRGMKAGELGAITPAQALRHPNWAMGRKITIDSATLMNKGLEAIEAHYLFDMPMQRIEVLVHPQSIVHSIVEFSDGSYLAQLSRPDMQGPIALALSFPERLEGVLEPLDWERLSGLTFLKPDNDTFPCLSLAYTAADQGGTMPAVLNGANEVAVHAFLDGRIGFMEIPSVIRRTMEAHVLTKASSLEAVLAADGWARTKAQEIIAS